MLQIAYQYALTVLGIGLIIFVHELGHFLAARWVGVRVETFSIGFGPRLFGFQQGPTQWKVCAIPLGGYVKMAGEDPLRPSKDATDELGSKTVGQRAFVFSAGVIMNVVFAAIALPLVFTFGLDVPSPVVGSTELDSPARAAGLLPGDRILRVNGYQVLGFDDVRTEIILSRGGPVGVEVEREVEGKRRVVQLQLQPDTHQGLRRGGIGPPMRTPVMAEAAFALDEEASDLDRERKRILEKAGIRAGDEVLAIGGLGAEYADQWDVSVLGSQAEEHPIRLLLRRPGGDAEGLRPWRGPLRPLLETLGCRPAPMVVGAPPPILASAGVRAGDAVVRLDGRVREEWGPKGALGVGEGVDPRNEAASDRRFDDTLHCVVLRGEEEVALELSLNRAERVALVASGAFSAADRPEVTPLPGGAAARAGLRAGDVIASVNGEGVASWRDLADALSAAAGPGLTLGIGRGEERLDLELPWSPPAHEGRYLVELPALWDDPPEDAGLMLGILQARKEVAVVRPGSRLAEAGLKAGDRILAMGGLAHHEWRRDRALAIGEGRDPRRLDVVDACFDQDLDLVVRRGEETLRLELEGLSREERIQLIDRDLVLHGNALVLHIMPDSPAEQAGLIDGDELLAIDGQEVETWGKMRNALAEAGGPEVKVRVRRNGSETLEMVVRRSNRRNAILDNRTVVFPVVSEEIKAAPFGAIKLGIAHTGRMVRRVFSTLRGLLGGGIAAKNLTGPIGIFQASSSQFDAGIIHGLLFMAFISINLAVLNILPIPVLDGGWLLFLLIEKIKGSPPGTTTIVIMQYAGLFAILGLFILATWNDIARLLGLG